LIDGTSADELYRADVLAVQTTFLAGRVFPPPATASLVLMWSDGTCAGFAADTDVARIVQRVVRHIIRADVTPHVCGTPRRQRIELRDAVIDRRECRIVLLGWHVDSSDALVAALPGDPCIEPREVAAQRFDLPDRAALLVSVAVEAKESLA